MQRCRLDDDRWYLGLARARMEWTPVATVSSASTRNEPKQTAAQHRFVQCRQRGCSSHDSKHAEFARRARQRVQSMPVDFERHQKVFVSGTEEDAIEESNTSAKSVAQVFRKLVHMAFRFSSQSFFFFFISGPSWVAGGGSCTRENGWPTIFEAWDF